MSTQRRSELVMEYWCHSWADRASFVTLAVILVLVFVRWVLPALILAMLWLAFSIVEQLSCCEYITKEELEVKKKKKKKRS